MISLFCCLKLHRSVHDLRDRSRKLYTKNVKCSIRELDLMTHLRRNLLTAGCSISRKAKLSVAWRNINLSGVIWTKDAYCACDGHSNREMQTPHSRAFAWTFERDLSPYVIRKDHTNGAQMRDCMSYEGVQIVDLHGCIYVQDFWQSLSRKVSAR